MSKKIKLAIIRERDEQPCPFGLAIPDGCFAAGKMVEHMTVVNHVEIEEISEEDKEKIIESNHRILTLSNEPKCKCMYANYIFKGKEGEESKVECNFGDNAAGIGVAPLNSAQMLNQYLGVSFYSMPIGFYNQDLTYSDGFQNFMNQYFASEDEPEIKKTGK